MPQQPASTAPPPRRGARSLALALLGLTVVLLAASVAIGLTGGEDWTRVVGFIPVALALALVGILVAARTGNRLGWLFLAAATVGAASVAADIYAARAPADALPGAAWAGWTLTVLLGIEAPLLFLTPLLFPDGRPPSPRWRPVRWVAVLVGLVDMVSSAISDVNFSHNFPRLRDPVTVVAPLGAVWNQAAAFGLVVFLAGAVSMIVRFRRSGHEQRLQLKWFMYASAISAVVIYAGLVLLATQVLGLHTPGVVAAATLVAAALFNPLRRRVQQMADRRFNRVRYDADQTVAAFAAALRDPVDLDTVRADLLAVVNRAVEPAHLSLWIATSRPGSGN